MTENRDLYPVRVDASLDPSSSRGLWLVKWLLLIPHYVVLALLWVAFLVVSVVAFFAILVTGRGGLLGLLVLIAALVLLFTARYPKPLHDLVVGIDRWSPRVAAYAALMTDAYPPFRLDQGGPDPGPVPARPGPTAPPVLAR